jgi:PAS domain S-box-containing protein
MEVKEQTVDEIRRLRACINDLVSVLALPAIWGGCEPSQIGRTLLDALVSMLRLDLAYFRLPDSIGGAPIEMVHVPQRRNLNARPEDIGRLLNPCLTGQLPTSSFLIPNPVGEGKVSIAQRCLGLQDEMGVLVAGSTRADFPTETERLLLDVAANQAVIGLQESRRLNEQRRVAQELDRRVAQRTREVVERDSKIRRLFDANIIGIMVAKVDTGEIVDANEAFLRMVGYGREDLVSGRILWPDLTPPEWRDTDARMVAELQADRVSQPIEKELFRKDGSRVPVLSGAALFEEGGNESVAFVLDLSEQKRVEKAARRSEKELRDVINAVPANVWSTSPDGAVDFVNERWQEFTGLPPESALGSNWETTVHPDDRGRFVADWHAALKTGQEMESEVRVRRADGEYRWLLVRNVPLRDELGNLVKWYGTGIDVEERKRTDQALHAAMSVRIRLTAFRAEVGTVLAQEESLRVTLHKCADAMVRHFDAAFARVWTLSSDGQELQLQASAGMYTRLDGSHSRIPFGQLKIGLIAQERKPHLTNDVENDPRVNDKEWARRENLISFAGYPLLVEDRVVGVMGMFSHKPLTEATLEALSFVADSMAQVIDRKRAEEALRRSEAYLAEAQRLSHTGSWVWDLPSDTVVYCSEELYRIFALDPEEHVPSIEAFLERVHPEDRERCRAEGVRGNRDKTEHAIEYRLLLPDGTMKYVISIQHPVLDPAGELVEVIGTIVDVTERKRAEAEIERLHQLESDLAQMNRVSMMGELAASLAHEIKQPIAAAATNARTCMRWLQRESPDIGEACETAARIVKEVNRAADMIDRNRSLYTRGTPKREVVDLNELVQEMIVLLRDKAYQHSISIRTEIDDALPPIRADRVQIQQVLMNLMLNGIEAMKDTGGALTITSKRPEDGQILLAVSDLGSGLSDENAERIFDAFFTTKAQGTGMGLCISRRIIESHGGRLWASANTGRGATFHFTLPTDLALASPSAA